MRQNEARPRPRQGTASKNCESDKKTLAEDTSEVKQSRRNCACGLCFDWPAADQHGYGWCKLLHRRTFGAGRCLLPEG